MEGSEFFELALKVAAVLIGVLGSFYQLRNLRISSRSSIKTDMEILKMLEPTDPNYKIVKRSIDSSIKNIYKTDEQKTRIYSPTDFIFGVLFMVGFSIWTYYLSRDGFSYWSILTGFAAFAGFGGILNGLDPKKNKKDI
jgi:hypothetical protein